MRVHSVEVIDQLDRDEERLVLLEQRALRLAGLAPAILDLTRDGCGLERLVDRLEEQFGPPPDGDTTELVRRAVLDLAEAGLVRIEEA